MRREGVSPEFIESLARGLDVISAFGPRCPVMSLADVVDLTGLPSSTIRRILSTLVTLGYLRASETGFALTPRVLDLGTAYVSSMGWWRTAAPHMERLALQANQPASIARLSGSDVEFVARASVPKMIGLSVDVGTCLPAWRTSLGKVLLAALHSEEVDRLLTALSQSRMALGQQLDRDADLRGVQARGWALADELLAPGIRSIAAPLRNRSGEIVAAIDISVHATDASVQTLTDDYLPLLLAASRDISADFARLESLPRSSVRNGPG